MAFTAAQLAQVESAIITVAAGGVAEIRDAFGNSTRYTSLPDLLALKEAMVDDISIDARTSGVDKFKFASKT